MIEHHLPALLVVVPLVAAVVTALIRHGIAAYVTTLVASWTLPVMALMLLGQVLDGGEVSYALGDWAPPVGIEYRVDGANAPLLVLVAAMAALVATYAPRSVASEIDIGRRGWFYTMFLLCVAGLLGIAITADAFNAFVFLEISSLATYVLIALGRDRRALLAAYQYLILGTIGATLYVVGVGLIFVMTGSLNMGDVAARLAGIENTRPIFAALAFITVGISLKLALFPLHVWLPNAYAFAPSMATAFLASTATKVAVYLLLRFLFSLFGTDFVFVQHPITPILLALSLAAMFAASFVAVFQEDIKRMLAYSSVAQIGYITLGVALATQTGLTGAMVHVLNHALIKGALFLAVGCIVYRTGVFRIDQLAGIGRTMPVTMAAFVIAGLGLIGVPGTVGFVSKWYLVAAALEQGWWWLALAIVASSLIAVVYVGRIVEIAWFREPSSRVRAGKRLPIEMIAVTWVMAGATIYFGLDAEFTAGLAGRAADTLLAGLAGPG
jgi:multicomponent Na+:H+ antiporter subunit D